MRWGRASPSHHCEWNVCIADGGLSLTIYVVVNDIKGYYYNMSYFLGNILDTESKRVLFAFKEDDDE
mgnify:CR=1 FL=1